MNETERWNWKKKLGVIILLAFFIGIIGAMLYQTIHFTYLLVTEATETVDLQEDDTSYSEKSESIGTQNRIGTTTVTEGNVAKPVQDVSKVVAEAMPSIVSITSTTLATSYDFFLGPTDSLVEGAGSGIIVGQNEDFLFIATNYHVVENTQSLEVSFIDDTVAEAVVKASDSTADIAVITVEKKNISEETLKKIKQAVIGDSEAIQVGEMTIAIGNAMGYGQSVTVGYLSAQNREVAVEDRTMSLLQTDAAINPGNSGGALLNLNGEVIGINAAKYSSESVERVGFAIPISDVMPDIDDMISREALPDLEKGYLGVIIDEVTEEMNKQYNMPRGIYLVEIVEGSGAEKAGLLVGDIIIAINGKKIESVTQLQENVTANRVGSVLNVTLMRYEKGVYSEMKVDVTLGERPKVEEDTSITGEPTQPEEPTQPMIPEPPQNPESGEEPYDFGGNLWDWFFEEMP